MDEGMVGGIAPQIDGKIGGQIDGDKDDWIDRKLAGEIG
jgi:hypothetical protein